MHGQLSTMRPSRVNLSVTFFHVINQERQSKHTAPPESVCKPFYSLTQLDSQDISEVVDGCASIKITSHRNWGFEWTGFVHTRWCIFPRNCNYSSLSINHRWELCVRVNKQTSMSRCLRQWLTNWPLFLRVEQYK